ncbi:GntR family transcriptional regulator [Sphingomonas abietis]|uniref:GntR family transcriptional regulator n=1 Tax=Sphingomonas abietis TaxID=3012344 RepID=A0ABY7NNB4_9SPHN|nr:GntR family transcriptional regulator [Sphingomonas abietis]WBO21976.1 GntR family transcriptional regulator [Sphingomonas abietis]
MVGMAARAEISETVEKKETTVNEVANALMEDIIFGQFRPRERLVEEELADRYGTSRSLARKALVELDRTGLIERRPNKGVIVSDFSIDDLEKLYEMRLILQSEAARRITRPVAPALIAELRNINAEYAAAIAQGDKKEAYRINTQFHEVFYGACGNRYLSDAISQYWLRTTPIHWYVLGDRAYLRNSHQDHADMIDGLESGDLDKVVEIGRDHILPALEAYRQLHGRR